MNKEIFEKCDTYFNEEIYKFFTEAIRDYIHNDFAYTQTIQPHKIRKPCQWGYDIQPEGIFRMERSKKWFNVFIKPLQEKGFRVRQIT